MDVVFTTVTSNKEISQILGLQSSNLVTAIAPEVAHAEGFRTLRHDPVILWRMNQLETSIISKKEESVVAYALIIPRSFSAEVPILKPMFKILDILQWRDITLKDSCNWFVMGQTSVHQYFRGQGIFNGLYSKMREVYGSRHDFTITEIAAQNTRSMRVHD